MSDARRHEAWLIGGAAVVAFLVLWELAFRYAWVNPVFISSPIQVAGAAAQMIASPDFRQDLATSASEFAIGYVIAIAVGIPVGLAVGWSRRLYYFLSPLIHTLNVMPRITLLPIIIIWFGIGIWSKVIVVFLGAVVPILISTYGGVRANEARFVRVARSFGASTPMIFRTIVLPGTVPFIFSGLKYGTGRALLGVVVGELYAATAGIGYFIASAGNALQTDKMLVGVAIVIAAGLATTGVLDRIERRFDVWRPRIESTP
jgi:ABC-type nitrate/sulfonate/bicarbonate transport system permease component